MRNTNTKNGDATTGTKTGDKQVHVGVLRKIGVKVKKESKASRMQRLVARCQQGDQAAFREIFDDCVSGVHRHLSMLVGPGPDTDDLVQVVFLNVYNSIKRFRGQSAFSTWLFRITVNVARQEIRQRTRRRRLDTAVVEVRKVQSLGSELTPERHMSTHEETYGILDRLPVKKRETYILYMYQGYSLEEIARLLDSSVSTIGSRLQSARKEIVKILNSRRTR
jgi:RNA polymerase sigma-70 factor, ECF subfamily